MELGHCALAAAGWIWLKCYADAQFHFYFLKVFSAKGLRVLWLLHLFIFCSFLDKSASGSTVCLSLSAFIFVWSFETESRPPQTELDVGGCNCSCPVWKRCGVNVKLDL